MSTETTDVGVLVGQLLDARDAGQEGPVWAVIGRLAISAPEQLREAIAGELAASAGTGVRVRAGGGLDTLG